MRRVEGVEKRDIANARGRRMWDNRRLQRIDAEDRTIEARRDRRVGMDLPRSPACIRYEYTAIPRAARPDLDKQL